MKRSVLTTLLRQANDSLRFPKAVWEAVHSACSTLGKNPDTDNAFERLFGLLRRHDNKEFVKAYVIVPHSVFDSPVDFVQPRTSQTKR